MPNFSIGVDLGGTNLRAGVMRQQGTMVESISLRTRLPDGRDAVIADLCDAVAALRIRHGAGGECVGVGIGTPGPVELPVGIFRRPPNLPGWDGFAVRAAIERRLAQPILLENDANVAALAEARFGVGLRFDADSLCMLTLGTGLGGGIILNGRILQGIVGMAGEVGHIVIFPEGRPCGCGSRGCLETYASATGLRRTALETIETSLARGVRTSALVRLAEQNPEFQAHDVAHLAEGGDAEALAIFTEMGRCLGFALATLVNTLNLPFYVLGGGSAAAWPLFAPSMFRELRERSYVYRAAEPMVLEPTNQVGGRVSGKTYVVPAELGADSGLMGAAYLPWLE